jgi:hypothetical protein
MMLPDVNSMDLLALRIAVSKLQKAPKEVDCAALEWD